MIKHEMIQQEIFNFSIVLQTPTLKGFFYYIKQEMHFQMQEFLRSFTISLTYKQLLTYRIEQTPLQMALL